ncbi:hypothetical protein IT575_00015 [bacterium]|nr:hypothetical protein [bacterium]
MHEARDLMYRGVGLALLCLAALATMLAGCSSGNSGHLDHNMQQQLSAGLPQLAELRAAAGVGTTSIPGTATADRSSGAAEEIVPPEVTASALRLDSSDGGHFEWAVYSVNPAGPLIDLQVSLDGLDSGGQAFIARANFELDAWEFSGPFNSAADTATPESDTGIFTLSLVDAVHRSPGGAAFIAVVTPQGSNIRVRSLDIHSTTQDAPVAVIQADITSGDVPQLVTFDGSGSTDADGTIVKFEWDTNGDGIFETDSAAVPSAQSSYGTGGVFEVTLKVTDDDGLTATDSLELLITEGGNLPPIPVLIADKTEGEAVDSFQVSFTSDQSEDLDGTITLYEWDLDGDATNGTDGFELSSMVPDPNLITFDAPGSFHTRLRVTDDGGLQRIATVVITSHGWVQVVADVATGVFPGTLSLSKVGKGPGLIYMDGLGQSLHFVRATSEAGDDSLDWSSVLLKSITDGRSSAMAFVDNKPTIIYADSPVDAVEITCARYVSGNILNPASWSFTNLLLALPGLIGPLSIAEVDGTPAITYSIDSVVVGEQEMLYARSATAAADQVADWQHVSVAQDANLLLGGADLTVVDGRPAFLARPVSVNALRYFHSTTALGLDPAEWSFVDLPTNSSDRSSLALINGNPAVCFTVKPSADVTELRYLRASNTSGDSLSDWGASALIDSVTSFDPLLVDTGLNAQIVQAAGQPVIGYTWTVFNSALLYSFNNLTVERSTSPGGEDAADWSLENDLDTAEASNPIGFELAMAEINGRLCTAYWNSIDQQVVYAVHF